MSVLLKSAAKMHYASTYLEAMTVDAKLDTLAILTRFARWKPVKREMTFARIKSVVPMLSAIWVNASVLQDLREMILTVLQWAVQLYPNVATTLIVATMRFALCCPTQFTGNVSMPVADPTVDPMPTVSLTTTTCLASVMKASLETPMTFSKAASNR